MNAAEQGPYANLSRTVLTENNVLDSLQEQDDQKGVLLNMVDDGWRVPSIPYHTVHSHYLSSEFVGSPETRLQEKN